MPKIVDPFFDGNKHLVPLPDSTLRDLARNEAAPRDYRKAAVEILWGRKSPYVRHEDLKEFVEELEIEFDGVQLEFPAPKSSPLTASVTTQTLYADPFDEHKGDFTGFDSVQLSQKEPDAPQSSPNDGVPGSTTRTNRTKRGPKVSGVGEPPAGPDGTEASGDPSQTA